MFCQIVISAIVTFLLILSPTSEVCAGDTEIALGKYVLAGIRAERESLHSGSVVLTGIRTETGKSWGKFEANVSYSIDFDCDKGLFRLEQSGFDMIWVDSLGPSTDKWTQRSDLPHGQDESGRRWVSVESGGVVVKTTEYDMYRAKNSSSITRLAPGDVKNTGVDVFDIRSIGLMGLLEFQQGKTIAEVLDDLYDLSVIAVRVESPKGYHCQYSYRNTKQEFWIDESKGMAPYRWTTTTSGIERFRSDIDSEIKNSQWVPVTYSFTDKSIVDVERSLHLTLDWKSVNQPVAPYLFTSQGIAIDANSLVTDMRLGKIIVEPVNQPPLTDYITDINTVPVPQSRSRLYWLFLGNLLVIGLGWWFYGKRRS